MAKASILSLRMPEGLAQRLENLAKATDRSKSYRATVAIEEFVAIVLRDVLRDVGSKLHILSH